MARRKPASPPLLDIDAIGSLPDREARKNATDVLQRLRGVEAPNVRQFSHSHYQAQQIEIRGPKVARNVSSSLLDDYLYGRGRPERVKITPRQHSAGVTFAERYRESGFIPVGKDAIVAMMDLGVVIRCDNAQDGIARSVDVARFIDRIRSGLPPSAYNLLVGVVIRDKPIGEERKAGARRWQAFRQALDFVADELRLPGEQLS